MESVNEQDGSVLLSIPEGIFLMGTSDEDATRLSARHPGSADCFASERPRRAVHLAAYCIGKYQVTNGQFSRFVRESGRTAQGSWHEYALPGRERHPVVCVTWNDAAAYCAWAGLRLPGEAEWESAARGADGREFPWGSGWDGNRCNNLSSTRSDILALRTEGIECGTIPVGMIPEGASPCGALDMAGNVWEWCDDWFGEGSDVEGGARLKALRGGSWHGDEPLPFRCAARLGRPPCEASPYTGFRCAR